MFKFFRKPKWTTIAASDIHVGDVVSKALIVGEVLFVSKENIQGYDYVKLIVDTTPPRVTYQRKSRIHVRPDSQIKVIQR